MLYQLSGHANPFTVTFGGYNAATAEDVGSWGGDIGTAYAANLLSTQSSNLTLASMKFRYNIGGTEGEVEQAIGSAGTGGPGTLPPNVAVLVQKKTGLTGRKNRGRLYFPGFVGEGDVDANGIIDSDVLATMQGHFDDFLTAVNASTTNIDMAILHHDASTPTPVTSLVVSNLVATQRRRIR